MPDIFKLSIIPGALSAIIAFLATFFVIKFAWKFGMIDDPRINKHAKVIHEKPTPRAGGLAIFLGVVVASLLFLPFDKHLVGILVGALIIVVVGLLDDKFNLNPYLRLIVQFMAASAPIAAGIGIAFITNPFGGTIDLSYPRVSFEILGQTRSLWILADFLALIWIVSIMNFVNMGAKGVDGQLSGVIAIAAGVIALFSLKFSADITQWPVIILASVTAGAFLGFLPWHIFPQKIMPGFSGSSLGGYLLAVLSILSTAKMGTLAVILAVPLIDTGYVIVRRVLSGKSPVWGDRGHLHHRLLDSGWSKSSVALFYWIITAVLGLIALNLKTLGKLSTIVGVTFATGGLILWLTYRSKLSK